MAENFADLLAQAAQAIATGDLDAAKRLLLNARKIDPNHPEGAMGLAAVAFRQGDMDDAVNYVTEAVSTVPGEWRYWEQLIRTLMATQQFAQAAEACAGAARFVEGSVDFFNYWGLSLHNIGSFEPALEKLLKAASLSPENSTVNRNIGLVQMHLGQLEESVEAFTRSATPLAKIPVPSSSEPPDESVQEQYEKIAENYDANGLHVGTVKRMSQLMHDTLGSNIQAGWKMLDCGCGTGLLGQTLSDQAGRFTGIDLSSHMITRAKDSGAYEELVVGNMVETMKNMAQSFDAIVCNNAIYHIADLAPFFEAASERLISGGYLFLSADPCTDEFEIMQTGEGEYAHSRRYLRSLASNCGLTTEVMKIMEHRAYPGFWCVFKKA